MFGPEQCQSIENFYPDSCEELFHLPLRSNVTDIDDIAVTGLGGCQKFVLAPIGTDD